MTEQPILTRRDLTTLRTASSMVVRLVRQGGLSAPFECALDLYDDRRGGPTVRTTLPINEPSVQFYEPHGRKIERVDWHLPHMQVRDELVTVMSMLRAGDRLSVELVVNNSTSNVTAAGLSADELRLRVTRPRRGKPALRLLFILDAEVQPIDKTVCRSVRLAPLAPEYDLAA